MTANELADYITVNEIRTVTIDMVSNMLRQQQAEIERLTMLCDCMTTESNRKGNEIEELKALVISLSPNANLIYTRGDK